MWCAVTTTIRRSAFAGALIAAGLLTATAMAVGPAAVAAAPMAVHVAVSGGSVVAATVSDDLGITAATKAKKKAKKKVVKKAKKVVKKAAKKAPGPAPALSGSAAPAASINPTALEAEVVARTNIERTAHGCAPLRISGALTAAARAHSADMAAYDYFSHTGRDGSTFVVRAARAGYSQASAENIAWGYPTAETVMTGWMNSDGHRRNILDCSSVVVGVGVAYKADGSPYYTQDLGRA
jgi:uncharacterized protein YkwD